MSQQINLFNPIFMKQRKVFSLFTMLQALGLVVLGTLLFYGYAVYQVNQLNKQSQESFARYVADQARLKSFSAEFSPQQVNQLLQEEAQKLERRVAQQAELTETMKSGAVGNTTGYSEYMRAFSRRTLRGLWLTGFRIVGDGGQMTLAGGVTDPELLPSYIRRLSSEAVMKGKTFSSMKMQQPKVDGNAPAGYVQFELLSTPTGEVKP